MEIINLPATYCKYFLPLAFLFIFNNPIKATHRLENPFINVNKQDDNFFDRFGLQFGIGAAFLNLKPMNAEFEKLGIPVLSNGFGKVSAGFVFGNRQFLNTFKINFLGMNSDASETSTATKFTSMAGLEMMLDFRIPVVETKRFGFDGLIGFGSSYYSINYVDASQTAPYLQSIVANPLQNAQFILNSRNNLFGEAGLVLYYKTHWLKNHNFAAFNIGLTASYNHSFVNKSWKMAGGYPVLDMPEVKLHQYSVILNVNALWHR